MLLSRIRKEPYEKTYCCEKQHTTANLEQHRAPATGGLVFYVIRHSLMVFNDLSTHSGFSKWE